MSGRDDFQGRTVLITGAARGIGFGIARALGAVGARVVLADVNRDAGAQAAETLRKAGLTAEFLYADLAAPGAPAAMVEAAAKSTGLDLLVNNARAGRRLSLLDESEENWDLALTVDLKAAFFAAQAAIKAMAGKGGAIVNVASVAATLVTNEAPSYHAAKAGLLQLSRYLAVVAGPHGVRVNCVLPGLIVQEAHRERYQAADNEPYRALAGHYQPLGAVGTEADVADAVMYLGSPRARYVSGACLVVDGGATVQEQFGLLLRSARAGKE